jgi:hypothetical protein
MRITMAITGRQEVREALGFSRYWTSRMLAIPFAMCWMCCVLRAETALAGGGVTADDPGERRFCSATARAQSKACANEVADDFFKAQAICINVSDEEQRRKCFAEAEAKRREGNQLCRRQLAGRRDTCTSLGESRYDPDFDPADFDDDFANLTHPNRYIPLGIGNRWEYAGGTESIAIEVLNETKLIAGVTCIVVQDQVTIDGDLTEDTDDWFAQAKNGDVYYCGEEVKDFESFDGDNPRLPELVRIDGSFKHGRDGDKGGIFFRGSPTLGEVYRQEFSVGDAEDVAEVLSTTYAFGSEPELDRFVPQQLAALLCSGDCVVTKEFSALEPGVFARKYYAPGIGFFLEVKPDTGKAVQLVDCNFDSKCVTLTAP